MKTIFLQEVDRLKNKINVYRVGILTIGVCWIIQTILLVYVTLGVIK